MRKKDKAQQDEDKAARELERETEKAEREALRAADAEHGKLSDEEKAAKTAAQTEHVVSKKYKDRSIWTPLEERLATRADANENGEVSLGAGRNEPVLVPWDSLGQYLGLEHHFWANPAHVVAQGDVPDDEDEPEPPEEPAATG